MNPQEYTQDDWAHILSQTIPPDPQRLSQSLKQGIPDNLRKEIWLHLTNARSFKSPELFSRLLHTSEPEIAVNITKDLKRTFPYMQDSDQVLLHHILSVYSQFDYQVGYCQGMSFVAGTLLLVIQDEELAFWAFVFLMYDYDWRAVYLPGTPKLNDLQMSLNRKLEASLLDVVKHFEANDVQTVMMSQHFLTLLAYKAKHRFSVRVMDLVLVQGGDVIVKVLYNMIKMKRSRILKLFGEYLFRFLMEKMIDECYEEYHFSTLVADYIRD